MKLTGTEAIEYAEANGLTLIKYADPIEDGREGLTPDEARKVADEDPCLIYLDAPLPENVIASWSAEDWDDKTTAMKNVTATPENDRSEWSRYQIRIIMESDCQTLGAVVGAANDAKDAKKQAGELASAYYYGVAVVDIEDGIVDAGECDGEKIVFDLDEVKVRG